MESTFFNLEIVRENFTLSRKDEDDVNMEFYLKSFDELNRFFSLLGTIFGFVSSELEGKIEILRDFLSIPDIGQHFSTVRSMINYERNQKLLSKAGYVSGSRTLLRLHRGLEFIHAFLKGLSDLREEESTSSICTKAYNETLANHHSFLIKTGARIAMYTLPVKHELLSKVCGTEENINEAEAILPETLEIGLDIYNRIQKIYSENNLLSLP